MFKEKLDKIKRNFNNDKNFKYFLAVGVFLGIATGIYSTIFNNFLSDTYHLSAQARGMLEFPRELPGALIFIVISSLAFLGDVKLFSIGAVITAVGAAGLGLLSPSFALLVVWMIINNLGLHMMLPLTPVIGMNLSKNENYGMRLGRYAAYNLFATIIGYGIIWAGFKFLSFNYKVSFIIASVFYLFGAIAVMRIKINKTSVKKNKLIFRKKYTLFYILSIVNGARKQIFLTFAPWVLIQMYNVDPPQFAVLGLVIAAVSIMTRTIVGKAIDIKGERFILSLTAILLIFICMGYAFANRIAAPNIAVIIIAACYVIDNSMSAVDMARSTYLKKIAVHPDDVSRTLAAGTSLDHVVAMTIPFFGGLLWTKYGYEYVFLAAALIAVLNFILSRQIKIEVKETVQ
ncbi:MAG: MFS transporter [Eubacteriaceae bacterium]